MEDDSYQNPYLQSTHHLMRLIKASLTKKPLTQLLYSKSFCSGGSTLHLYIGTRSGMFFEALAPCSHFRTFKNLAKHKLHLARLASDAPPDKRKHFRLIWVISLGIYSSKKLSAMHTGVTPTRKSNRDSCWQFDFQASTGVHWLRNHVKVMGEREILNKSYKFS